MGPARAKTRSQGFKLRLELVPESLWKINLRSHSGLGKKRWDKLRRTIEPKCCAISGSTRRLQGHEVWKYFDKKNVVTLVRVDLLCQNCHDVTHWGRTQALAVRGTIARSRFTALRKHFRTVNECRQADFDRHIDRSFAIWRARSSKQWRVDWGDFAPKIAEAATAREAWAARIPDRYDDAEEIGPGHHGPDKCPKCGGTLQMIDQNTDDMSDGELADYEAGVWSVSICRTCGEEVDWGF